MPRQRRVLPTPRWHGSPNNLLPQYVAFLKNFREYQTNVRRANLIRERNQLIADIERTKSHIDTLNKELVTAQHRIDEASPTSETQDENVRLVTLSQRETVYQSLVDDKTHRIRQLREFQARLRVVDADLTQHNRQTKQDNDSIDRESARKDLELITTGIPGVMGLRFRSNAPVLHVRTSVVWENRRYDLGDFEVSFTLGHKPTTHRIIPTRLPQNINERRLYWQSYEDGWFCFGNRAEQLDTLFAQGSFAQFLHYTVNSLCEVNREDLRQLEDYPTIPIDEVWVNRPRRRARRPKQKG